MKWQLVDASGRYISTLSAVSTSPTSVIFDEQERVLLMCEKTDSRWSLLGGWADLGDAPSAAVTRETLEETRYHSSAVKLIAC